MKIELKDLREHPVDLDVNVSPAELEVEDPEFTFPEPIRGALAMSVAGDKVLAKGRVDTRVESSCVRCLSKVLTPVRAPIDVVYEVRKDPITPEIEVFGGDEDDERIAYFDGEVIIPDAQIREAIMLELPPLPLCRADCKGLCPVCGIDLNEQSCTCQRETNDPPPWKSALKNMKLE